VSRLSFFTAKVVNTDLKTNYDIIEFSIIKQILTVPAIDKESIPDNIARDGPEF